MSRLTRFTTLLIATLALLAIGAHGIAPLPVYATSSAALGSLDALSLKDRVEVFEEIWETINEKYYNASLNGVDWRAVKARYRPLVEKAGTDGDFYVVLKQMV